MLASKNGEAPIDTIKKILAPTDLSQYSLAGVRYALNLAKSLRAEVTVYHVVNNDALVHYHEAFEEEVRIGLTFRQVNRLLKSYQLALARFLNEHASDLIPRVRLREKVDLGVPDKNIVQRAAKEGSDLIVITIHGESDFSHASAGSVAEKVIGNGRCPVLAIPSRLEEKASHKSAAIA